MDADFYVISNQIFSDLSYLKSLNQVTLEYMVSKFITLDLNFDHIDR